MKTGKNRWRSRRRRRRRRWRDDCSTTQDDFDWTVCDAARSSRRHPASLLTDLNNPSNRTCWISAPTPPSENSTVNLTVNFGKKYEVKTGYCVFIVACRDSVSRRLFGLIYTISSYTLIQRIQVEMFSSTARHWLMSMNRSNLIKYTTACKICIWGSTCRSLSYKVSYFWNIIYHFRYLSSVPTFQLRRIYMYIQSSWDQAYSKYQHIIGLEKSYEKSRIIQLIFKSNLTHFVQSSKIGPVTKGFDHFDATLANRPLSVLTFWHSGAHG